MKLLDRVLEANKKFVAEFKPEQIAGRPREKLAIVTCMDTRLVDFSRARDGYNPRRREDDQERGEYYSGGEP